MQGYAFLIFIALVVVVIITLAILCFNVPAQIRSKRMSALAKEFNFSFKKTNLEWQWKKPKTWPFFSNRTSWKENILTGRIGARSVEIADVCVNASIGPGNQFIDKKTIFLVDNESITLKQGIVLSRKTSVSEISKKLKEIAVRKN